MITQAQLQQIIDNNLNLLIEGSHGVGKTEMIKEIFKANNFNYLYFSASTLDPLDFVGIPRATQPDENGEQFLEYIRPKAFMKDNIDAIFIDEFNRSPDKVTNALMELMQFKSINGQKLYNLRFIWVAVNPFDDDSNYAVHRLDPAVKDRFQVQLTIPRDYINSGYFERKYGIDTVIPFLDWFKSNSNHKYVSPRRLDYAIEAYNNGIDLKMILPFESNVDDLLQRIKQKNPTPPPPTSTSTVTADFKADGSYTLEEALAAWNKKKPIKINLEKSLQYIPLIEQEPEELGPVTNFLHDETWNVIAKYSAAANEPTLVGQNPTVLLMQNYDPDLCTTEFSYKVKQLFLFHTYVCNQFKYARVDKHSVFHQTVLKGVLLKHSKDPNNINANIAPTEELQNV